MRKNKFKMTSSSETKLQPNRINSKIENLKQKMQAPIMEINERLQKEKKIHKNEKMNLRIKLMEEQEGCKEDDIPSHSKSSSERRKSDSTIPTYSLQSKTTQNHEEGNQTLREFECIRDTKRVLSAEAAAPSHQTARAMDI